MKQLTTTLTCCILLFCISSFIKAQKHLTPQDAIKQMMRGINIGNTMDAPEEGTWGNPIIAEQAFDDYKNSGFTAIRIPITWDKHVSTSKPYTITQAWLDRVEQVVDWGLKRKLIIIIDAHHESWLKTSYTLDNIARFDSIWSQIATRFKSKSDSLLFEILNEPYPMSMSNVTELNPRILKIIRKTNPSRIVIFSGNQWAGPDIVVKTPIPDANDKYLMAYYHSYNPYPFGLEGTGSYGTDSDISTTKAEFDNVANWSTINNMPVIIDEFGAQKKCDYNSRMTCYGTVVDQALAHNIPFFAWDDGGDFPVYYRLTNTFNEIKDILINTYNVSPNKFKYQFTKSGLVSLSWVNRTNRNDSIVVQRSSTFATSLSNLKKLAPDATQFTDSSVNSGYSYYYRLQINVSDTMAQSYPIKTAVVNVVKSAINEVSAQNGYSLYPNPAKDQITFQRQTLGEPVTIKIYDLNGVLQKSVFTEDLSTTINLNGLTKGLYVFKISTKTSCESKQIAVL
jgi:aryl-phospho-beta-D-glucosidase BglC (GH1 family)